MEFTDVMFLRQLRPRWSMPWHLWFISLLIMSGASLTLAQGPVPAPPPLFGAEALGVVATADVRVDFTLDSGFVLSGEVTDANGVAVSAAMVVAQSETGVYSSFLTLAMDPNDPMNPSFKYRLVVPAGAYQLFISTTATEVTETMSRLLSVITHDLQETVVVSGDTEKDLVVPTPPALFTVSGQVFNQGTLPSQGRILFQSQDGRAFNVAELAFADPEAAQASYNVTLSPGTYDMHFMPTFDAFAPIDPSAPMPMPEPDPEIPMQSLSISVGSVTVGADQAFNITLPAVVTLSGLIQDSMGMPVAPALVSATSVAEPSPEPSVPSAAICQAGFLGTAPLMNSGSVFLLEGNTTGHYELPLVPGAYEVAMSASAALQPPATVPAGTLEPQEGLLTLPFPPGLLTLAADQVEDFTVPSLPAVVVISGVVSDQQGQPVSEATVTAVSSMLTVTPEVLFANEVQTDATGHYQLLALSGVDYRVTVCLPASFNSFSIVQP